MKFIVTGGFTVFIIFHFFFAVCLAQKPPSPGSSDQDQTATSPEVLGTVTVAFTEDSPDKSYFHSTNALPGGEFKTLLNTDFLTVRTKDTFDVSSDGLRFRSSIDQKGLNKKNVSDHLKPTDIDTGDDIAGPPMNESFRWREATKQSLMFLSIQHGYALTQPKTRTAMKGKFWKDYASSVKSLKGWSDGGRFFTNYVAHPMQGAFLGYIQVQNDPKGMKQQFGASGDYWRSRMKALAWSAAWSTQFEIGPLSQASIGNVGLEGKQTYIDIVVTPTIGTAWLITEDAADRYLIRSIERRTKNLFVIIITRMLLNPTRSMANLFRFQTPWHRDRPRVF